MMIDINFGECGERDLSVPEVIEIRAEPDSEDDSKKRRARRREYCRRNREKFNEYQRRYCAKHREEVNLHWKQSYLRNRETRLEHRRKYYAEHREEILERRRKRNAESRKEMGMKEKSKEENRIPDGTEKLRFVCLVPDEFGRFQGGTAYFGPDGWFHASYDREPDLTFLVSVDDMTGGKRFRIE